MKNTLFLQQRRARTHLRFGSRTVILFESEMPMGDTPMERHVQELSGLLCQHAAKAYLPAAAAELEMLAGNGTGYEFSPHRLLFCARPSAERGRVRLRLWLSYEVKGRVCREQVSEQVWSADGAYRLR